jgi:hypothetical protein
MPSIWRKSGGSWVKIKTVYRKTNGSWQSVKRIWRKSDGTWRLVFLQSLTPSIAQQVSISMLTTTTQTKTLVGTLYRWSDATSVTYQFAKSTNDITYSNISGASGTSTNPTTSNTLDRYTLSQSDVSPNTTNYYKYISKGINSTFGTEQTSASDYITLEASRDLTLTSTKTSTSITVSWTNDTYSGRYEYQYKLSSSGTYGTSVFIAPGSTTTSFTLSSLLNDTNYDIQVRGWTGTSSGFGYYGNWSTITVRTDPPTAPNSPTNVRAASGTIDTDSFFLEWTASTVDSTHDAATSYDFGINSSSNNPPTNLITTGNPGVGQYRNKLIADTNLYELISSLSSNTTYYAYVRAKNSGGSSSWAASGAITTEALKPPNNITNLIKDTSVDSETSLKFTWTAPSTDSTHNEATSYVYSYGTTNSAPTNNGDYETFGGGAGTEITLTGLTGNTTYYIFIKAKNADGLSSTWVSQSGKTKAASNPPGTPTSVSLGNPSQSGLRFTWAAGTGGTPTSYVIALSTTTTEPTTENLFDYDDFYYDTATTTTNFTFGLLDPNKTYYAWVKARNADGTSASVRRNATTAAAPSVGAPTWTSATNFQRTSTQIRWGWGNTGTLSPTSGTYTAMTRSTMFWQFYTTSTTNTVTASGSKDYTTTNDTRTTVNSVNFPYLLTSGSSSPDVTYSTSGRFVRVQASAYDYDGKSWDSAWTARI